MSGKVIQTLRASPLLTPLTEAEYMALANCGRIYKYSLGETVLQADGQDERMFILRDGRVALHLVMWTDGGQCGGEATLELALPGEAFGWATWVRPDRIAVSAHALEPVSLVVLDLEHLRDSQTFLKVRQRMLQNLYGRLEETSLCPPNMQMLLKLGHVLHI
jgi:CRP-like cAMP-binding protein